MIQEPGWCERSSAIGTPATTPALPSFMVLVWSVGTIIPFERTLVSILTGPHLGELCKVTMHPCWRFVSNLVGVVRLDSVRVSVCATTPCRSQRIANNIVCRLLRHLSARKITALRTWRIINLCNPAQWRALVVRPNTISTVTRSKTANAPIMTASICIPNTDFPSCPQTVSKYPASICRIACDSRSNTA